MIKTYKLRISPSKAQIVRLNETLALCSELYNAGLQERKEAWERQRKSISWFDQNLQLKDIRHCREDVALVSSMVLENVLKRVDLAFKAFFRRVKARQKVGYPRFRSARRYDSITFRQIGNAIVGNKLHLPKIGNVRIKLHRPIEGAIKTLTIKREAGRWFGLFVCEVAPKPLPYNPNTVGVDVGLTHFATLSDGTAIENPRWYRNGQRALRIAQRRLARRKKGSNRRRKAIQILQRAHIYIRNQRADFHHKLSRQLVNDNGLIAAEDLNIKGLARGYLSKSVNDAGWGQFLDKIAYKAESAGRVFIRVNPSGTSQTCTCGAVVRKTLKDRWHLCLSCGLSLPRDHISAQVVLSRAKALPSGVNVEVFNSCVA